MTIENFLKKLIIAGIFILPVLPFIVANSLFFPFVAGKGFFFRIIIEIVFASFLVLALLNKEYRPSRSPLLVSVSLFTLVIFLADIFGVYSYKSLWSNYERMEGFVMIFHLFLYFLVLISVFKKEISLWGKYLKAWLAGSFLISLYSVFQLLGVLAIHQGTTRVDASFGNATYLAVYLLFNIFIALYFLVKEWSSGKTLRWVYGGLITLQLFVLYFTATRGAILGLLGGLIIAGLYIAFFEKERMGLRKGALSVLSIIVIFVGGFLALKDTEFVRSSPVLGRFAGISLSETTTKSRFIIWDMSIEGFKERPILGFGQENFNYVFNKYYDPNLYGQEEWFDRAHNVVFDWLIAGGILGLLAYLSLFASSLYILFKSDVEVYQKGILLGLISGYFFQNLFVFDNVVSYVMFFSILGFIHSLRKGDSLPVWQKDFDRRTITAIILPVVFVVMIFTFYLVNLKPILAGNNIIKALGEREINNVVPTFKKAISYNSFGTTEAREHLAQSAGRVATANGISSEVKGGFLNSAKEELDKEIEKKPDDARYYVFGGSLLSGFGLDAMAVEYYSKARELSPKKQSILFALGSAYLNLEEEEKALEVLEEAYLLQKEYSQAKSIYAIALIYNGRLEEAEEILALESDTPLLDQRIATAYFRSGNINKGVQIIELLIERDPENYNNYVSLAAMYSEVGRIREAIEALERAIELNPSFKDQGEYYIQDLKNAL